MTWARCVKCGRFVGNVMAKIVTGIYGEGIGDATGTCKACGTVEAIPADSDLGGWAWEDFFGEES